jgi:hypothetical protein
MKILHDYCVPRREIYTPLAKAGGRQKLKRDKNKRDKNWRDKN